MSPTSPPPDLSLESPEMVRRLGMIVTALAALVARRFLRHPKLSGLVGPLWSWLNRRVQRFARAVARPVRVAETAARARHERKPSAVRGVRLPVGRGWLVRELGWEAAAFRCQLETLLAEPAMVALLAAKPAVGRVLRPLGWMLGVPGLATKVAAKPVTAAKPARAKREQAPPWPSDRPRPTGSWWPLRRARKPG